MTQSPQILLTDPEHYDVSYAINPWMHPDDWKAHDAEYKAAARSAWQSLEDALMSAGFEVHVLPGQKGVPDMVFPANAAIVLDGTALMARFKCPERQGEEPHFKAGFERLVTEGLLKRVETFPDGLVQEGAGDAIWDKRRGHFWCGYGQRSDEAAIAHIEAVFGKPTVPIELVDPRYYHLDVCMYPLEGGEVVYFPGAFSPASRDRIKQIVPEALRIEATEDEANLLCLNAVRLDRHIICAQASPRLRSILGERGYTMRELDLKPFILSGGAAYCMTLRLDLVS
ncbi:MAG: dimethylarginine dimethylaminohydrolase family protein [Alphaproteobacteria bacterium]